VTQLPILVDAVPYEKRDGRVIDLGRNDIAVRILPLDAVAGLFDPNRKEEINREFNQAFKVSESVLNDLKALVFLIQAITNRSHKELMGYVKSKASAEASRAEQHVAKVLAELGDRKPGAVTGSDKDKYLRDAVESLLKRKRYPLSELSRQLNAHARRARFVLWWDESKGKFAPGLYCDNLATALATALFSRVVSPKSLAVCQRCGNPFIRAKRPQRFCSLRCGNADRKARQRERAKHRKSRQKRGRHNGAI
jgi:hypothetical protein